MMHFHPLANVLPMIEGSGYTELVADIKANGQHDPIITLDDQILDGRNRYLACLEAGIEPRFAPFEGTDPAAFVISKNLHRRHLNAGQRAMAIAKYATITNGRPCREETAGKPAVKTVPEIAAMVGVNKETVSDARTIQAIGTLEEINSVVNGSAPISTVANAVRARRDGTKPRYDEAGYRIKVPEGKTVSDLGREAIKLEQGGASSSEAAKQVGLAVSTYATVRDVLLLAQRDDLSRKERATVVQAQEEIDTQRRVLNVRKNITPIARRVWGSRGARLKKADERRAKQFDDAIEFLKHTCENAVDMVVPHITRGHAEAAIKQLSDAEAALRKLSEHIRETQHGR